MMVQAQYLIGFGHHQMQVMGNHQYGAIQFTSQLVDKVVQCDLPIDIYALGRLIEHQ